MKLSESLLKEKDFGQRIFKNSIDKTKKILANIFQLDFENQDTRILSILEDKEKFNWSVMFDIEGRKIIAYFNFENKQDDILSEVLEITELEELNIHINVMGNFQNTENSIMEILENKYDINFTPLDPDEVDPNIREINSNSQENKWEAYFTSPDHEAEFKAEYIHGIQDYIKISQYKKHKIYLE